MGGLLMGCIRNSNYGAIGEDQCGVVGREGYV